MSANRSSLFLPHQGTRLSLDQVWQWFGNIPVELAALDLSQDERKSFTAYYEDAGLLRAWRRPFFRRHYAAPLCVALQALFEGIESPRIIDLGAGSGTQSLLFAMLGAHVTAVDMDSVAFRVLEKRKRLYEEQAGRPLAIDIVESDVFETDWRQLGPFTGLYSLFAFNMMQPSRALLARLEPSFSSTAVIAIQDGNNAHFFKRMFKKYKRNALGKHELENALQSIGFADVRQIGGYAIPPPVWRVAPYGVLAPIDNVLTKFDGLSVSFLHLARRGQ